MDLEQWPGMSDQGRLSTQRTPGDLGTDGASVLVIDDDPEIHRLLRARLEARGYLVTAAASGEQGLSLLRELRPDLVFLDVAMSGMTGIDVLDFIRSQHLDVAVILTAFSSEQVAIDALRHGADDYLRKPFDRGEFQAALDRTLARLLMSRQIARCGRSWTRSRLGSARRLARAAAVQSGCCLSITRRSSGSRSAPAACRPAPWAATSTTGSGCPAGS